MKSFLKIALLTLLSCCYLNTVFEFCDNEKKANFENETHTYIQLDSSNLNFAYSSTVKQIDNEIFSGQTQGTCLSGINGIFRFTVANNFSPPERRYILYATLLI